jgi:hypothetical protein
MTEEGESQIEEGLSCVAELIYNQNQVSQMMWSVFGHITNQYLTDKGCISEYIPQVAVCIINFMNKSPNDFKNMKFGSTTPLDVILGMIQKIF